MVFKIFNSTHDNIAFTKELEKNNTLPFLDTLIHRTDENQRTLDFIPNGIAMCRFSLSKT